MANATSPFQTLQSIAERCLQLAAGLPAQEEAVELWNGIGFTVAGKQYVAPMGTITEILHLPKYTKVPGVKGWMYGAANVRGRLIPIMDLGLFFELPQGSVKSRDKRVLVIENGEILSGLIVDSVLGMQYFSAESFQASVEGTETSMQPFLKGAYMKNDSLWHVFDAFQLTKDETFIDVSMN